jgi:translation elongation factor EF-G
MSEKSMFEKNIEMWERFVNTNMDLMFKSMEKTMEGSKAFQEQVSKAVDRAVDESNTVQDRVSQAVSKTLEGSQSLQEQVAKAVNTAVTTQLELTLTAIKSLERQVETLSERVDEFVQSQKEE